MSYKNYEIVNSLDLANTFGYLDWFSDPDIGPPSNPPSGPPIRRDLTGGFWIDAGTYENDGAGPPQGITTQNVLETDLSGFIPAAWFWNPSLKDLELQYFSEGHSTNWAYNWSWYKTRLHSPVFPTGLPPFAYHADDMMQVRNIHNSYPSQQIAQVVHKYDGQIYNMNGSRGRAVYAALDAPGIHDYGTIAADSWKLAGLHHHDQLDNLYNEIGLNCSIQHLRATIAGQAGTKQVKVWGNNHEWYNGPVPNHIAVAGITYLKGS